MALEISATDVIKIVLQFCKENGLTQSFNAIQDECQVTLNTVANVDGFLADVRHGRWDAVLPELASLSLPVALAEDLHEHVLLELVEAGEGDTARPLLRQGAAFREMKRLAPQRFARLERLCASAVPPGGAALWEGTTRDERRAMLCKALAGVVTSVPASRLMALVGQALKWQQEQGAIPAGTTYDLFRGQVAGEGDGEEERVPEELDRSIKFGEKSHPEIAAFAPDGLSLATGSADGFIEVWDPRTARLRKDLAYQAEEKFMIHDEAVLALCWSADSQLLVSGCIGGKIKVWRVATGQCIRRFDAAHVGGVTSVALATDGRQVLSAGYDGLVRVHGIKSGRALKEFRGHASFVNCAVFARDDDRVLSCSADGTVRVWDARSTECLAVFRPPAGRGAAGVDVALERILLLPGTGGAALVVGRGQSAHVMTLDGTVVRALDTAAGAATGAAPEGGDVVGGAVSPRGEFVYLLTESGWLHTFVTAKGTLEASLRVAEAAAIGVAHHPRRNLVATWTEQGVLSLWKPR